MQTNPSEPTDTDHDRLFKELLSTFFVEFIELFFPKLAENLEPGFDLIPISQEILNDIGSGERHVVDLLMRGKFKGRNAFFLIHVENQATKQGDFPKRMFEYFARLTLTYEIPVYPIVVFSYDAPKRAEPSQYVVTFPHKTVMRFDYEVVQLNRIPWRKFLKSNNPVATALMAKMKIAVKDRPKARAELPRMLASHKLDPVKTRLPGMFIDRYLTLTAAQMQVYERQLAGFAPAERQKIMELKTSWELVGEERGMERGLHEGMEQVVMRQIRKRLGLLSEDIEARIDGLASEQLSDLSEALLDFTSLADLEEWLAEH